MPELKRLWNRNDGDRNIMKKSNQINEDAPVYFLDLIVENVRCFRERQVLDLSDGDGKPARWTVLLGDNGTGKTTLLKCLAGLELFIDVQCEYRSEPDFFAEVKLKNFDLSRNTNDDFFIGCTRFYNGLLDSAYNILEGYSFQRRNIVALPTQFVLMMDIYAYGASRRMGTGSLSETRNPDNSASLFFDDASLINAEEWLLQADFAVKSADNESKSYFENRFDRIKKLLISLLPDVDEIRIKPITKEQKKPGIELRTPYGWVGLKNLSLGYQTLIAWMTDLANRLFERYPDSDNPLAKPAIVLVDEIDLHLHPKWQRSIMRHLTDILRQTQFIVTAHSPLIVQSAQDANIVLLRREDDQVIIHNNKDREIIKGWRLDQVVTSDLFDLPSARPSVYDSLLEEREKILAKPRLTQEDEQRLEEIGEKLDELPIVTENREDSEAMKLIRKAAKMLKEKSDDTNS
jgi:predicted ATP-binding protein involved in virulence